MESTDFSNYEIRRDGSIVNRQTGKQLQPFVVSNGYLGVTLYDGGGSPAKTAYVHQLVAGKFVPKPAGATRVRHINGAKSDNRAENLEWIAPHRKLSELPLVAVADQKCFQHGKTFHFVNAAPAVKFLQGSAKVPSVTERAVVYAARHNTRLGIFTWSFDKEESDT